MGEPGLRPVFGTLLIDIRAEGKKEDSVFEHQMIRMLGVTTTRVWLNNIRITSGALDLWFTLDALRASTPPSGTGAELFWATHKAQRCCCPHCDQRPPWGHKEDNFGKVFLTCLRSECLRVNRTVKCVVWHSHSTVNLLKLCRCYLSVNISWPYQNTVLLWEYSLNQNCTFCYCNKCACMCVWEREFTRWQCDPLDNPACQCILRSKGGCVVHCVRGW